MIISQLDQTRTSLPLMTPNF